jgi:hypothetical protein
LGCFWLLQLLDASCRIDLQDIALLSVEEVDLLELVRFLSSVLLWKERVEGVGQVGATLEIKLILFVLEPLLDHEVA